MAELQNRGASPVELSGMVESEHAATRIRFHIVPDLGGADVYLHQKQLVQGVTPQAGQRVTYELRHDAVKNKCWARNIRAI